MYLLFLHVRKKTRNTDKSISHNQHILAPLSVKCSYHNFHQYNSNVGLDKWLECCDLAHNLTLVRMDTAHIYLEIQGELLERAAAVRSREQFQDIIASMFELDTTIINSENTLKVKFDKISQRFTKISGYNNSDIYQVCLEKSKKYGQDWHDNYYSKIESALQRKIISKSEETINTKKYI